MNNRNRIKIQNADTRLRVYLYRAGLKAKRNRLLCREMPFFSSGQNKGVLFAYGEHFYILYSIKNCTNEGGKKDSFFVNSHNCFLPPDIVLYTQKAVRRPPGASPSFLRTLTIEYNL